jgi:4,5-DOPA dioxygenase extradiol
MPNEPDTTPRDILFLSHGAPSLMTGGSEARVFLEQLGPALEGAHALVVVSAHWESAPLRVTAVPKPTTVHDFRGFGPELERFTWPVSGAPELAKTLAAELTSRGVKTVPDRERGLDHGVWVPLALALPSPEMPVLQVSLPQRDSEDDAARRLGAALGEIASELGIQLVFSGAATHSLTDALKAPEGAPVAPFAEAFNDWVAQALESGDADELANWRAAPQAARNHKTPEHFRPLLAATAAAEGQAGRRLHASWTHGALAMDVWSLPGIDASRSAA